MWVIECRIERLRGNRMQRTGGEMDVSKTHSTMLIGQRRKDSTLEMASFCTDIKPGLLLDGAGLPLPF